MKQDWKALPSALQHQMLIQMGLALLCLILAIWHLSLSQYLSRFFWGRQF